jgi:hypothetical protein
MRRSSAASMALSRNSRSTSPVALSRSRNATPGAHAAIRANSGGIVSEEKKSAP